MDQTVNGTNGNDVINTGAGNDTINAFGGNDVINSFAGNDTIDGGDGNDSINAGLGADDEVDGGAGIDLLRANYALRDTGRGIFFSTRFTDAEGISGRAIRYAGTSGFTILDDLSFDGMDRFSIIGTSKDDSIETWRGNDAVNSGAGNDTIEVGDGNDVVNAGSGDDFVEAGAGNDIVNAGSGNDTVDAGTGFDRINGGDGIDTAIVDVSSRVAPLRIANPIRGLNIAGVVAAANFEAYDITSGSGNDVLSQAAIVDGVLVRGADRFAGGDGNDIINVGLGVGDRAEGGTGNDLLIADYSKGDTGRGISFRTSNFSNAEGVSGRASRREISTFSALDDMQFFGIDRFSIVGTSKDDDIKTWSGNDVVASGAGNDTLELGDGNDTVSAGSGDDRIGAGAGDDIVNAGSGNDTVEAGTGFDRINGGDGIDTAIIDISSRVAPIRIANPTRNLNIAGRVVAVNFEAYDITSGSGDDVLSQAAIVDGVVVRGSDRFAGGDGNDIINVGLGLRDQAEGGTGNDLLIADYSKGDTGRGLVFNTSFSNATGVTGTASRSRATSAAALDSLRFIGIDRFSIIGTSKNDNIETWTGNDAIVSGAGNDTIDAGDGNDIVNSGSGDDRIDAGAGNDVVNAGTGNDTVEAGTGFDRINGGIGIDTAIIDISSRTAPISIINPIRNLSIAGVVAAVNFEAYDITAGSGDDVLSQAAIVNGVLVRGADRFVGGDGNDIINVGLGVGDRAIGGTGNDLLVADYSKGDTGRGISFITNNFGNSQGVSGRASRRAATGFSSLDDMRFEGIDRFSVIGTSKDDTIEGWTGNDAVVGGAGNDRINAGDGNDSILGGAGADTLTGEGGADRFIYNAAAEGGDTITDFTASQGDVIAVSAAGFGGGLSAGSPISAAQFVLGSAATDASDRFIYNQSNGALLFDVDGSGFRSAVQLATLSGSPAFNRTNITVLA